MTFAVFVPLLLICGGCSTQSVKSLTSEIAVPKGNLSETLSWPSAKATDRSELGRSVVNALASQDHQY